jgi:Na+/H+ antiporter NhaD/arsenite permease-like protein
MTMDAWIAAAIFVVAYVLIAMEHWDRTAIALVGGMLVVVLGVIDQQEAFAAIDLNVIFLLAGMMVIASVLAKTGFFELLAIESVRLSHGHPIRLLLILAAVTAVLSAFLDNVTTVVLMTPIIFSVAKRLDISPMPYLLASVFASNIGGTATLIGDPPNILIGSAAGLGFGDFLLNLAPVVLLAFLAFAGIMVVSFRHNLQVPDERRENALERAEGTAIKNRPLLYRALAIAGLTILGFLFHSVLGLEVATVALLGAAALMLVARLDVAETLKEIEWSTLFFFVGLFILVEGLVATGIVGRFADGLAEATAGNSAIAVIALLWFSGFASAIVDNIPYTATAIPVVDRLVSSGMHTNALWWALSLGACLGGNLTIIGASANVVVANMADRAGHPIRFAQFLRYGAAVFASSLAISTVYLWVRYFA